MTKRWKAPADTNDAAALAARLPDELTAMRGFNSSDDIRARWTEIARWLDAQVPGQGEQLVGPVLAACGLSIAHFYAAALGTQLPVRPPGDR